MSFKEGQEELQWAWLASLSMVSMGDACTVDTSRLQLGLHMFWAVQGFLLRMRPLQR